MMLREMIVQHQRGAVDLEMGMHEPAVVRFVTHLLFGTERPLVELDGILGASAAEIVSIVAETADAAPAGFVHAEAATDPVTQEACAYVALLAVTEAAQGQGVASRLMEAVEDWARQQGFRLICLDVFANNRRARDFYARHGYRDDSLRLTKPLR